MEQTFKPKNSLFIIFVCLVPLFPYFSSISSIPLHFLLCSPAHIPPAHPPPPGTFILTLIGKGAAVSLANLEVPHHSCLLPPDQAPAGVTLGLGSLAGGLGVMVGILVTGRWTSLSPSSSAPRQVQRGPPQPPSVSSLRCDWGPALHLPACLHAGPVPRSVEGRCKTVQPVLPGAGLASGLVVLLYREGLTGAALMV